MEAMKGKAFILAVLAALTLSVGCGAARQTSEEKSAEQKRTEEAVSRCLDEKKYQIEIDYMMPLRGPGKSLTDSEGIKVEGSVLSSYLPYFGVAHSVPYGGGKGLNFQETIEKYQDEGWKKDGRDISISVSNDEDSYVYQLTVYKNGNVSLTVSCQNKDSISYRGELRLGGE